MSTKLIVCLVCIIVLLTGCAPQSPEKISGNSPEDSGSLAEEVNEATPDPASMPEETSPIKADIIIEPEQLITQSEAEKILGAAVTCEKREQPVVGQKICYYDAGDTGFLQISLTQQAFMPSASANTPKGIYDSLYEAFPDAKIVNIGDEAFLATGGYNIMQSGYYITVFAGNIDDAGVIAILDESGKLAVKNLLSLLDS